MNIASMPSLALAAQKIASFEGFRALPYLDSASVPTIGYGTTRYPGGQAVTLDDRSIRPTEALCYLEHDLSNTALTLWKSIVRQPGNNQWAALLSIAYNVGVYAIAGSTLLRLFNAGCDPQAGAQFLLWDKAHVDGKLVEIQGLLNRREAESALFLTPDA